MHMVLRVVVEATDATRAVEAAEAFFDERLHYQTNTGGRFDYCTPMVESDRPSGANRWTEYEDEPLAYPLASEAGQAEVWKAWNSTCQQYRRNMYEIWQAMQEADGFGEFYDEVVTDDHDSHLLHVMNRVCKPMSGDKFLYVPEWSAHCAIEGLRGWEYVQECIEDEQAADEDGLWVVPLDVHY